MLTIVFIRRIQHLDTCLTTYYFFFTLYDIFFNLNQGVLLSHVFVKRIVSRICDSSFWWFYKKKIIKMFDTLFKTNDEVTPMVYIYLFMIIY